MSRGLQLDGRAVLAAGLAVGLLAHAAPVAAAAFLVVVLTFAFRSRGDATADGDIAPLAALALVAGAAMIGGPSATIAAALVWRTTVELQARRDASREAPVIAGMHIVSAPAAVLLHRLDAPLLLVVAALCVAGVAWADWLIRRLADWRLDAPAADGARAFVVAQAAVLAPLVIFPAPQTCLAAFVAMGAARAMAWRATTDGRYATAR